ncbi:MAG: 30S ribosomal protein S20 [Planctomycetes bacterium]|nr:30S ribosomal protein S20 [Planctomycetota bacterium]
MAHSLSAKKRIRQNAKRRTRNRAGKSAVKTQIKKFTEIAKQPSDVETLEKEYRNTQKQLDQLASKGVIHKNTIARKKAQLARKLNDAKSKIS